MKQSLLLAVLVAVGLSAGCKNKVEGPETIELGAPAIDLSSSGDLSSVPPPPLPPPPGPTEYSMPPDVSLLPPPAPAAGRVHVVQPKETLYSISRQYYGVATKANVSRIVQANPEITDPNRIRIGQKIVIPD